MRELAVLAGLESDRDVFKRYREIRKAERESMVAPARPAAQIA
jgi:hypothetical protein